MKPGVTTATNAQQTTEPADSDRLLRVGDVAVRLGISIRQVWKLLACGRLPAPLHLGRAVRWRAADISRFIALGCPSRDEFEQRRAAEGGRR